MRTDFQLAIITSLGFCAVLGIVPFSIYRFLSGNTFAGIVDLIISAGIVVAVVNAWQSGNVKRAGLLLAIVNTAGCLLSASVLGPPGQYWMYPALVGNFLLLGRNQALLLTASALVFLTVQGKAYDSRLQLVMFLVSASVTSMIAFVFASRTETQRQQLEALATLDPLTGPGTAARWCASCSWRWKASSARVRSSAWRCSTSTISSKSTTSTGMSAATASWWISPS